MSSVRTLACNVILMLHNSFFNFVTEDMRVLFTLIYDVLDWFCLHNNGYSLNCKIKQRVV